MEKIGSEIQNTGMENTQIPRYEIIDRATELAYASFSCPTDDHITGIYDRLVWNELHGLGELGAVTLH